MLNDFSRRATNVYWSYRWTFGGDPVVFFGNPKVNTNVIYTLKELRRVVGRSDSENSFIPVPRNVLESALDVMDGHLELAA